jgi:hypothetical protein
MMKKTKRAEVTNKELVSLVLDLIAALNRQLDRHGRHYFSGKHEAYGMIAEEMTELMETVRDNDSKRFRDEAMDVAVAALWATRAAITCRIRLMGLGRSAIALSTSARLMRGASPRTGSASTSIFSLVANFCAVGVIRRRSYPFASR